MVYTGAREGARINAGVPHDGHLVEKRLPALCAEKVSALVVARAGTAVDAGSDVPPLVEPGVEGSHLGGEIGQLEVLQGHLGIEAGGEFPSTRLGILGTVPILGSPDRTRRDLCRPAVVGPTCRLLHGLVLRMVWRPRIRTGLLESLFVSAPGHIRTGMLVIVLVLLLGPLGTLGGHALLFLFGSLLRVVDPLLGVREKTLDLGHVGLFEVPELCLPVRSVDLVVECIDEGREVLARLEELGTDLLDGHDVTAPAEKTVGGERRRLQPAELPVGRKGVPERNTHRP